MKRVILKVAFLATESHAHKQEFRRIMSDKKRFKLDTAVVNIW